MRNQWCIDSIHAAIKPIAEGLGHFPSRQELESLDRSDLCNQISRRGGFLHWSEKVGIARQMSDSDTGWEGERMFGEILSSLNLPWIKPSGVKSPYDILVDGVLRVDVKAASYAEYGYCRGWFYRIGKHAQADVIALVQLDTKAYYAIPWYSCPKSNVTISRGGGIYKAFANNRELLTELISMRHAERDYIQKSGLSVAK